MAARKSYPQLLTPAQAVELLTARKTRPKPWRITAVLDRLADQRDRGQVEQRVVAYWAPLPARARVAGGQRRSGARAISSPCSGRASDA